MSHSSPRTTLLGTPAVRWVIISCLLANVGAGMVLLTMSWTVVNQHASVSALAGLMVCFWLPSLLFAPAIGLLVDRADRRHIVMATKVLRVVALFAAAALHVWQPGVAVLMALAFVMGSCAALYTPALLAMVRELVDDSRLLHANSMVDIAFEVGFIIGMPISGALMMITSPPTVLLITAALFAAAFLCMLFVRKEHLEFRLDPTSRGSYWQDSRDGIRYLLSDHRLILLYSVQMLVYVTLMTTSILLAPFAKVVLGLSSGQFGAIEASLSVGTVVGAFALPAAATRWGYGPALVTATLVMSFSFAIFALTSSFWKVFFLYFVIGTCLAAWPVVTTAAQRLTEKGMQGRVQTAANAVSSALILLMYGVVGGAGAHVSIRWSYASVVIISAMACVVAYYAFFVCKEPIADAPA